MATPRKIDEFVPYRLLLFVEARLRAISSAMAYNTDPYVTGDWHDAEASDAKHTLFFEGDAGAIVENFPGSQEARSQTSTTYKVVGVSKYETEHARRLSMALEQDVRTSLGSDSNLIRAAVGRGVTVRFGSVTYDGGILAPKKEVGFRLLVTFTWTQAGPW
jgi:hypothetical protein